MSAHDASSATAYTLASVHPLSGPPTQAARLDRVVDSQGLLPSHMLIAARLRAKDNVSSISWNALASSCEMVIEQANLASVYMRLELRGAWARDAIESGLLSPGTDIIFQCGPRARLVQGAQPRIVFDAGFHFNIRQGTNWQLHSFGSAEPTKSRKRPHDAVLGAGPTTFLSGVTSVKRPRNDSVSSHASASAPIDFRAPAPPPERAPWQKLKPQDKPYDPLGRSTFVPVSPPKRQAMPRKLVSELRSISPGPCELVVEYDGLGSAFNLKQKNKPVELFVTDRTVNREISASFDRAKRPAQTVLTVSVYHAGCKQWLADHQYELENDPSFLLLRGVTVHKRTDNASLGARMSDKDNPTISYSTRQSAELINARRWGDDWMEIGHRPPSPERKPAVADRRSGGAGARTPEPAKLDLVASPIRRGQAVLRTAATRPGFVALLTSLRENPPSSLAAVVAGLPFEAHRIEVAIASYLPASTSDWTRRRCPQCSFVPAIRTVKICPTCDIKLHWTWRFDLLVRDRSVTQPVRLSFLDHHARYLLGGLEPCDFRSTRHRDAAKVLEDLIATLTACASSPDGGVSIVVVREPGNKLWACVGAGSIVNAVTA